MKKRTPNTGLAKVAVQCSAETFVVNQTLVLLINICGENRHLRQARKRYSQLYKDNQDSMTLSNRIRKIREAYDLTQVEVADRIGCTGSTYGEFERNADNASIKTLLKISLAIGVSLSFLIDRNNPNFIEM